MSCSDEFYSELNRLLVSDETQHPLRGRKIVQFQADALTAAAGILACDGRTEAAEQLRQIAGRALHAFDIAFKEKRDAHYVGLANAQPQKTKREPSFLRRWLGVGR